MIPGEWFRIAITVSAMATCTVPSAMAQQAAPTAPAATKKSTLAGPSNPKSEKEFKSAIEYLQRRMPEAAIDAFKKAVRADPACVLCAKQGIDLAISKGDNKSAAEMASLLGGAATSASVKSYAQFEEAIALYRDGAEHNKMDLLEKSDALFVAALKDDPTDSTVLFADGMVLAHLKRDAEAKARFEEYLKTTRGDDLQRSRAERYLERPELARARMAPNFRVTTLDGKTVSMDSLQGKVVLVDFWATWCGPCNQELPHVQEIAKQYAGRPLVVLSVSWDKDETKWKDFIGKHGMTWEQYRDADQSVTKLFNIESIPHYFTIDTDGVLQTEQLGGGSDIDGKLKKMVTQAEKKQVTEGGKGGQ
jgi:thiol-disulfide isomerase/thioredoxin